MPHWRADGVTYYVTFRHRRDLSDGERGELFKQLLRMQGRRVSYAILCVRPEASEMLFTVEEGPAGEPYELSDLVEKAKGRAGKVIIKASGERWAPFYGESYDRIVRDEEELEATWGSILGSVVEGGWAEDPEEWETLFVPGAPGVG